MIHFIIFTKIGTICTTGRTEESLTEEGTGTGLWIQNGPSAEDTVQVPEDRPESEDESENHGWTKNNCFPAMGKKARKFQACIFLKIL